MNRSFKDTSNDIALVQEVSKESEANTVLSGSLSQIGQSYILTATLTELTSNKLLGSFRAESDGKDHLLEALTAGITPQLNETLSRISGKKIQSGGDVGQVATNSFEAYTHFVKGSETE